MCTLFGDSDASARDLADRANFFHFLEGRDARLAEEPLFLPDAFSHSVDLIGPPLKQLPPLRQVKRAIVSGSHCIAVGVRQGDLDHVGRPQAGLVRDGRE